MTEFEEFIKEKVCHEETITADPFIWDSIEQELKNRSVSRTRFRFQIAASILILISIGFIFNYTIRPFRQDATTITLFDTESGSIEKDFMIELDQKLQVLRTCYIPKSLKENFNFLINEFKVLDVMLPPANTANSLHPNHRISEEELYQLYAKKLKILNRIEQEVLKINKLEKLNQYESKKILLPI